MNWVITEEQSHGTVRVFRPELLTVVCGGTAEAGGGGCDKDWHAVNESGRKRIPSCGKDGDAFSACLIKLRTPNWNSVVSSAFKRWNGTRISSSFQESPVPCLYFILLPIPFFFRVLQDATMLSICETILRSETPLSVLSPLASFTSWELYFFC
jgi:hypothetical protein